MTQLRFFAFFIAVGVALASWVLTCVAWQADSVIAGVVPLDPRSFERLTLVTAGTGGAWENPDRLGPVLAVGLAERVALVDAGRGTAEALRAAEIPVSQPEVVYLTSLLPENTLGLDDLLLTGWLEGRTEPLRVVGPPGTATLVERLAALYAPAVRDRVEALALPEAGAALVASELSGTTRESWDGMEIHAAPLGGGPAPALAYRFESAGRALVVAPVGWGDEAVAELARGAEVLVREAAFVPTPEVAQEIGLDVDPEQLRRLGALHTPIEKVGEIAEASGVETLVLVRLRPPPVYDLQITSQVGDRFSGRIAVADDGDEITP